MREIINDKRYAALKTLGERKQAFNEVSLISISYGTFGHKLMRICCD
jgi:hypothetical protein